MRFDHSTLICPTCEKEFPADYHVKNRGRKNKVYGTGQLMKLWAWNNFKRHKNACVKEAKK